MGLQHFETHSSCNPWLQTLLTKEYTKWLHICTNRRTNTAHDEQEPFLQALTQHILHDDVPVPYFGIHLLKKTSMLIFYKIISENVNDLVFPYI